MQSKLKNKIYIVTSPNYPEGNKDLKDLLFYLRNSDIKSDFLVWGDTKVLRRNDLLLLLGVWDYSSNAQAFLAWLEYVYSQGVHILNPLDTIKRNIDKHYLLDLQKRKIPIIPSQFVNYEELKTQDLANKIVKPFIGQSGIGVERGENVNFDHYRNGAIIQPFIPSIQTLGEVCLVFFDKRFQYSILRKPSDWRANSSYGVEISSINPKQEWIELASKALEGFQYFYARVDLFLDPLAVSEVELIEPALYFSFQNNALDNFVHSLLENIKLSPFIPNNTLLQKQ